MATSEKVGWHRWGIAGRVQATHATPDHAAKCGVTL